MPRLEPADPSPTTARRCFAGNAASPEPSVTQKPQRARFSARTGMLAAALALLMAGCAPTGTVRVAAPPPSGGVAPANWNPPGVTAARALQLFEGICGASLPGFSTAPARMEANGITLGSPHGTTTRYSATENVSFKILDEPDLPTCSMVFKLADSPQALRRRVDALGSSAETGVGRFVQYRDKAAIVFFEPNGSMGLSRLAMHTQP